MLPDVTGVFRVVADPELRFTTSGKAVASMRLVADKKKKQGEEWVDDKVCWLNASAWERMAENIAETFQQGDLVFIKGALETRNYETREGVKGTSLDLLIYEIGPSLKWNAARIERTQRQQGAPAPAQQAGGAEPQPAAAVPTGGDPWGTPAQGDEPPF